MSLSDKRDEDVMGVAVTIKRYLDRYHVAYGEHVLLSVTAVHDIADKLGVPPRAVVKAVPMNDRFGLVMAVIPAHHNIDFKVLSGLMGRKLEPASTAQVLTVFRDCDGSFIPPVGEAYGVRTIIDDQLVDNDSIYFAAGDGTEIIQVSSRDFFQLQSNAWLCSNFTRPMAKSGSGSALFGEQGDADGRKARVREVLKDVSRLPPMPKMAQEIIRLSSDPQTTVKDLSKIVELDPSLAAQVLRYARSPLFGYQGSVDSIQVAISRVLGFDMVMNLVLGLATAKPFKVQRTGPLGMDSFWRHAIYSAAISQALVSEMPESKRPKPGLAYLSGLLHNFGHVILGHVMKKEFARLNETVVANPDVPVTDIEKNMLDMGHGELGAWLMSDWGLPQEIIVATKEHHDLEYSGEHAVYAQLVLLTDHMLKNHGMGDATSGEIPQSVLDALGLTEVQTLLVMNRVLEGCEGLNLMAQQLAA